MKLRAGSKWIEVQEGRSGRKLAFRPSRRGTSLDDEFSCMVGGEFDRNLQAWLVTDCDRNHTALRALRGEDPFARFKVPFEPAGRRPELMPHQRSLIGSALQYRTEEWAADPGTGKTLAAIEVMELSGLARWWWVGPAQVLADTKRQFERWGATLRPEKWITWHGLPKAVQEYDGPAPEGIIFDEASRLRGCGEWFKAARHVAQAQDKEYGGRAIRLNMTGTPAPLDPLDWFGQIEVLVPALLRESSKADLAKRLAIINYSEGFPQIVGWRKDEVEKLARRIAPVVRVVRAKDVLELPPFWMHVEDLEVSLETKHAAKMLVATSATGAEALGKLRQLSDGFQYVEVGSHESRRGTTPKDDALREKLSIAEDDGRIVIYAGFRDSIDRCVEVCESEGWKVLRLDGRGYHPDASLLSEFEAGCLRFPEEKWAFVGHPKSGGLGLNLTAPRYQVLYSLDFDGESYEQCLARLHRKGQTRGVTVWVLCHLKTDRYVLKNLQDKVDVERATLDEIRRIIS